MDYRIYPKPLFYLWTPMELWSFRSARAFGMQASGLRVKGSRRSVWVKGFCSTKVDAHLLAVKLSVACEWQLESRLHLIRDLVDVG